MRSTATTVTNYLQQLPPDRQVPMEKLRATIAENLPSGFTETMGYGMIGFVVPHELYSAGYHCDPKLPLPFINIASQKHFIALYHMGLYADKQLLEWFTSEYSKQVPTKLDMGKSCVRFKKPDRIPFALIAELAGKMTVQDWVERYELSFGR